MLQKLGDQSHFNSSCRVRAEVYTVFGIIVLSRSSIGFRAVYLLSNQQNVSPSGSTTLVKAKKKLLSLTPPRVSFVIHITQALDTAESTNKRCLKNIPSFWPTLQDQIEAAAEAFKTCAPRSSPILAKFGRQGWGDASKSSKTLAFP